VTKAYTKQVKKGVQRT